MPTWAPLAFAILQTLAFVALAVDRWVHSRESAESAMSGRLVGVAERMTQMEVKLDRFLAKQSDKADHWQERVGRMEIELAVQKVRIETLGKLPL